MSRNQGDGHPPPWLLAVLALLPLAVVAGGWFAGSTATERISRYSEYTAAMIIGWPSMAFAVILGISVLVNFTIIAFRIRDRPRSYRWARLPLWLWLQTLIGAAWIGTIYLPPASIWPTAIAAMALAVTAVVTFSFALIADSEAAVRRHERLAPIRSRRSPRERRAILVLQIGVPSLIVGAIGSGVAALQTIPVEHRNCTIVSTWRVSGSEGFDTDVCGDFQIDGTGVTSADVDDHFPGTMVDITSRGYGLRLPPTAVAVIIRPAADQVPGG